MFKGLKILNFPNALPVLRTMEMTDMARQAARFVNSTNSHIFLTGKAGTGKTTFLAQLSAATHKQYVIVAPTGIAALNAKGVTIHSQFLLPLGSYMPSPDVDEQSMGFYNAGILARRHPLNAKRRDVLRHIDLLIIDEVSMLRADLLDAIDARLRMVKRNRKPFGNVQLLLIGDMYQLPPVIKDAEWTVLRKHYESPHFFSSKALSEAGCVYVELDRIFRQQDNEFISILNNLRNNETTQANIDTLNEQYQNPDKIPDDVITITTHNYKADEMNRKALAALEGKATAYRAKVEGDFPESAYPVSECIELKKGARVMFMKNDTQEGAYFNGKLATIVYLDKENIDVRLDNETDIYTLRKELWENKKYNVDPLSKELEEEIVGTFKQYPIKLAWAITVHKSQGLTFEKAIIDVGQAFAPGQVYVALSRLTSLEGLVLRTKVNPNVVSTDQQVVAYAKTKERQGQLADILQREQGEYIKELLANTFDLYPLQQLVNKVQDKHNSKQQFEDEEMRNALTVISDALRSEFANTNRFQKQLDGLLNRNEQALLLERIQKGSTYYLVFLEQQFRKLLLHVEHVAQFSRTKAYRTALDEIDLLFLKKWEQLDKVALVVRQVLAGEAIAIPKELKSARTTARAKLLEEVEAEAKAKPKNTDRRTGRVRKKGKKKEVGATYKATYALAKEGLSMEEIAEKRALKSSTIESHLAKGIGEGAIDIEQFMGQEDLESIEKVFTEDHGTPTGVIYAKLNAQYTYGQIRMVQAHLAKTHERKTM